MTVASYDNAGNIIAVYSIEIGIAILIISVLTIVILNFQNQQKDSQQLCLLEKKVNILNQNVNQILCEIPNLKNELNKIYKELISLHNDTDDNFFALTELITSTSADTRYQLEQLNINVSELLILAIQPQRAFGSFILTSTPQDTFITNLNMKNMENNNNNDNVENNHKQKLLLSQTLSLSETVNNRQIAYVYTIPVGISQVYVMAAGGGGMGGNAKIGQTSSTGGGGGASPYVYLQLLHVSPGDVLTLLIGLGGDSVFPDGADTEIYVNYENPTTTIKSGHGTAGNLTEPGLSLHSNVHTFIGHPGKPGAISPVSAQIQPAGNGGSTTTTIGGFGATATTAAKSGIFGSGGGGGFPVTGLVTGANGGDGFVSLALITNA